MENKRIKILYLLRGLPGSGKTLLAKTIYGLNFESDMYFMDEAGNFNYNPNELQAANIWCRNSVMDAMYASTQTETDEFDRIIVSNNFTTEKELGDYYKLAKKYEYHVFSVVVENRHSNAEEIPPEIKKLIEKFETRLY